MTELVDPSEIEKIVGVPRHPTEHWAKAVSSEERVYILHSVACLESSEDLRSCEYSRALDNGIREVRMDWPEDVPLKVKILRSGPSGGYLIPSE